MTSRSCVGLMYFSCTVQIWCSRKWQGIQQIEPRDDEDSPDISRQRRGPSRRLGIFFSLREHSSTYGRTSRQVQTQSYILVPIEGWAVLSMQVKWYKYGMVIQWCRRHNWSVGVPRRVPPCNCSSCVWCATLPGRARLKVGWRLSLRQSLYFGHAFP